MEFIYTTRENYRPGRGIVVVVDVLRAFTTAAYALAAGAERIVLATTVEEARRLQSGLPGALLMGEQGGLPLPGFDFGNSPAAFKGLDLAGAALIQRTSAGTQGMALARDAQALLAGSFVCAGATARLIHQLQPERITFMITGNRAGDYLVRRQPPGHQGPVWGDEDQALAEYLEALLRWQQPSAAAYLQRVRDANAGRLFSDPAQPEYPAVDLELAAALDTFDFALRARQEGELLVLRKEGAALE